MRRLNGSIATNDADTAQILANHFETVFTRESSLPEEVSQNRTDVAKIEYAQITCGDVKRILKSIKKDNFSGPEGIPPILLTNCPKRSATHLQKFFRLHWNLDDCQKIG